MIYVCLLYWQSLSDRGSSSRQVSRPSSLGSSISDVRDDPPAANTQPSTPITSQQQPTMAAAAAAVASGAMTPNGDIDYKKVHTHTQMITEVKSNRMRDYLFLLVTWRFVCVCVCL